MSLCLDDNLVKKDKQDIRNDIIKAIGFLTNAWKHVSDVWYFIESSLNMQVLIVPESGLSSK